MIQLIFLILFSSFLASANPILHGLLPQSVCAPFSNTTLYSNLVNYWQYDGSGNIANGSSIYSNVGVKGVVTNTDGTGMSFANGVIGDGIKFGGDDFIFYGNYSTVITDYTVALWVKPGISSVSGIVLIRGDSSSCFYNPQIELKSSTGDLLIKESGCGGTGNLLATTVSTSSWTHIVVTRSNQTAKVYINGVLVITDNSQPAASGFSGRIVVGAQWHSVAGYQFFSDATVDDVAIWNTALSATDIATLYGRSSCR